MQPAYEIPQISATSVRVSEVEADLVVVPIYQDDRADLATLNDATAGELQAAVDRGEVTGKLCETWTSTQASGWQSKRVMVVGAGNRSELDADRARRLGACVTLTARQQRRARVAISGARDWSPEAVESLIEGAVLGNFENGHYKSKPEARFFVSAVEIAGHADPSALIARGVRVGESVNAARVLINEPGNRLTPREFVARGQALLAVPGVTTEVLDEHKMEQLGMGLLLGVARGSAEPPRLLVARYEPASAAGGPVLGLVGKGVTFDTGGISIKPADGMERMKDDMAGGACVIAALRTIALEQIPIRAMAVVPATENMPSGTATKPGDVHTSASGLTVEVNNTDAEGRLILGDALWYAQQLGATHLIDVATLTGACIVALGKITTGLFATEAWAAVLQAAAARGGEKVWPMPLFEEYRDSLKSEIADMLNSPGRPAGAITAAMFLKEFVGTRPWAHLDIAGTAWAEEAKPWTQKGATGVMIRTLVEVARTAGARWPVTP
jgi:leucyl aminopeptidase